MKSHLRLWIAVCAASGSLAAATVFHANYVDLGSQGTSAALATDSAGNHFVVSQVIEPWGLAGLRATKTDAQGSTLASFDFGGDLDIPTAAAADAQGNLVVVGTTALGTLDPYVLPGPASIGVLPFVYKLDSGLTQVLASTTIDTRAGHNQAISVVSDSAGNVYVGGTTDDITFPVTPGAYQTTPPGINLLRDQYAFLVKLSPDLKRIIFGTYFGADYTPCTLSPSSCLGKIAMTSANAVALDSAGDVVIAGSTNSPSLPVTAGSYSSTCVCQFNESAGFVAKFSPDGSHLLWSTFLSAQTTRTSGFRSVVIRAMAMDSTGNLMLAGSTPDGFPVTSGALQATFPGTNNNLTYAGFLAKLDAAGANLLASTYFGSSAGNSTKPDPFSSISDAILGVAVDSANTVWVTGLADVNTLPGAPLPFGPNYAANLSADLSSVVTLETAALGAAGQSVASNPVGSPTILGSQGSLLFPDSSGVPDVVAVTSAAGTSASGAIAPLEVLSFYGFNLGPNPPITAQVNSNGLVESVVQGYAVLFNGIGAPLLYVGPNQINCVVPFQVAGAKSVQVQLANPQGQVPGPTLFLQPSRPTIFRDSQGFALALNEDGSVNSAANPAGPGSVVTIWATGAGMEGSPDQDGQILPPVPHEWLILPTAMLSREGSQYGSYTSLEVLYAGDAPGAVYGVVQVNFRLPPVFNFSFTSTVVALQVGDAVSGPLRVGGLVSPLQTQIHVHR